ncbi:MAG: hypothetical protein WBB19_03145 [Desulforhopalus sp.]
MQTKTGKDRRFIAWNGVSLHIPADWDARVSGQRHLVFEKDFDPQLQIRWEKSTRHSSRYLQERLTQFAGEMGTIIPGSDFPKALQKIKDSFNLITCYQGKSGRVEGGAFLCDDNLTLVLFQLLLSDPVAVDDAGACLSTLSCAGSSETLWCVQDFSLTLPDSFLLQDYTFAAGLTRISFYDAGLSLQTCKLGPADTRLGQQSLAELLITLTGTSDLVTVTGEDGNACEGHRKPSILKQVVFRLRREKPFIRAKIWHDAESNRLLAIVLSSKRPISVTTIHDICSQYEIVQKKNTA